MLRDGWSRSESYATPWPISSARDEISSFWKSLRRWYSTIRGLKKTCAAISFHIGAKMNVLAQAS